MNTDYKKRASILFFIFCFLYLIIVINLYFIQIRQHTFFNQLGEKQYTTTMTITPARAPLLDRTGKHHMAINKDSLSAFLLPKKITEPERTHAFLQEYFPQAYNRLQRNPTSNFLYIKRALSDDEIALIANHSVPDIKLLHEPNRFYPIPSASTLIGITNIDNKGLFGMELQLESTLAGSPVTYTLERDARSGFFHFNKETKIPGTIGTPVTLTIDGDLQFLVDEELKISMERFKAKEGSALVIDPKSGDILALVNRPYFDPNHAENLNMEETKNSIITQAYELGSVIKVCAALAALEEGVVTPDELIDCKDCTTTVIDGRTINTVTAHGIIPFTQVVERSNNIGTAIVAKRLNHKLYDHYVKLGFGKKTGITFPGESKGFLNPPHNWSKQSIISLSYGYEVSATILQLAKVFCIIANGGYDMQPRLIMSPPELDRQLSSRTQLFSPATIATIKEILTNTTLRGTTKLAGLQGYTIMSKTGTALMLTDGAYDDQRRILTCAGIIEKNNYQRVVVVSLKEPGYQDLFASVVAAPLFRRVAEKIVIHDRVLA